jgi:hypothetical protein
MVLGLTRRSDGLAFVEYLKAELKSVHCPELSNERIFAVPRNAGGTESLIYEIAVAELGDGPDCPFLHEQRVVITHVDSATGRLLLDHPVDDGGFDYTDVLRQFIADH